MLLIYSLFSRKVKLISNRSHNYKNRSIFPSCNNMSIIPLNYCQTESQNWYLALTCILITYKESISNDYLHFFVNFLCVSFSTFVWGFKFFSYSKHLCSYTCIYTYKRNNFMYIAKNVHNL